MPALALPRRRVATRFIVLVLAALFSDLGVIAAAAQTATGWSAADSATAARDAWGRAAMGMTARDLRAARREIDRAASFWPTQPAYVWGRAVIAALENDTAATRDALRAYADLGLGRDVRADPRFKEFTRLPGSAAIVAQLDANRAPVERSRVHATLPDSTFWPEGMDYDDRTGRLYVASVRHRLIVEMAAGRPRREIRPRDGHGAVAMLGVRVDPVRRLLWVTTSSVRRAGDPIGAAAIAALLQVRIDDGTIQRRWDLAPSPRGHTLGDLAIGPAGDVFVTDSDDPALYRLRPGADTLERITNSLFHSPQGLAPAPEGGVLYVADYSHGLLRVDLATNDVTRIADAPHSTSLGCDGIAWDRGAIVAVQNGVTPARIMRFVLDRGGRRIVRADLLDRDVARADEPTIGAIIGRSFVYVANSQWEKYRDDGSRAAATRLTAPILLAVPLPKAPR